MIHNNCKFIIKRKKSSYNFKKNMKSKDSWNGDHNAQHNMEDEVILLFDGVAIFSCKAQTVANMPGCRHTDTIFPGSGSVKWDVQRRSFKGHVHGIVGFMDYDGQIIDENSVQPIVGKNGAPEDWARWIFCHSTAKNDPAPEGEVTRFAWSAGCVITTPEKQSDLFSVGLSLGFKPGDLIPCKLIEVE